MVAQRFPVETGHITMFARAVGDADPAHDEETGEMLAPPTFVVAAAQFDPDYPMRPRPGEPWSGSNSEHAGRTDSGVDRMLHAEQHFTYHRPVRAGDVLRGEARDGDRWQKQGRRGGVLLFSESITDYRDQDGELVVTVRSVGVQTEHAPVAKESGR